MCHLFDLLTTRLDYIATVLIVAAVAAAAATTMAHESVSQLPPCLRFLWGFCFFLLSDIVGHLSTPSPVPGACPTNLRTNNPNICSQIVTKLTLSEQACSNTHAN